VHVTIVLATSGEAGTVFAEAMNRPEITERLAEVREGEARCAAAALGARAIEFLGYPDGGLADVDLTELTMAVAAAIRRTRPDVVITFGPEGIYGHPDHTAIGEATTAAFDLAADSGIPLNGLGAHSPARLFYQVIAAEMAEALNSEMGPVMLNGEPHPFVGYSAAEITTRVDATSRAESKVAALLCHETQTSERAAEIREWLTGDQIVENYVLAQARAPDHPGLATDLVAGLSSEA
jgi:LmbE family N-acetylglucosaminyl deacetylase